MSAYTDKPVGISVTPPTVLPQLVPSLTCLQCDVCCRFPDPDSALRPYFTESEITRALAGGVEGTAFPNRRGSQVILVPDLHGEGYLCPAFDSATSTCRIYEQRPLDCQLYPLALMWDEAHDQVLLGWDTKCPFMREEIPEEIQRHADRVMALLDRPDIRDHVVAHPRLIGRFQEDVVVLARLPRLTDAVARQWGPAPLHRLTLDDIPRMTTALDRSGWCRARVARSLFAGLSLHVEWITGLLVDGASGGLLPLCAIAGRLVHAPASDRGRLDRRAPIGSRWGCCGVGTVTRRSVELRTCHPSWCRSWSGWDIV